MAVFCLKFLPVIIIFFAFHRVAAQDITYADTIRIRPADTVRGKITDTIGPRLVIQDIPDATICTKPFYVSVSGGVKPYTYTSSNPAAAIIDPNNGLIQISGAGITTISVIDAIRQKQSAQLIVKQVVTPSVTITETQPVTCLVEDAIFTAKPGPGSTNCLYSWFFIDNQGYKYNYPNNGNAVLKLNNLVTGDKVYCTMTSTADGCTTPAMTLSNPIIVTVVPYSTIAVSLSQSPEGTIISGTPITFTATAILTPPYTSGPFIYTYQWQRNGSDVPNANSATYTSSCSLNDDYYNCIVSTQGEPCVTPVSSIAPKDQQVTIINSGIPITATITASTNDVYSGTVINFQATLSSNAHAVAYQWQINGIDTSDVTSALSTFSLKNNDVVTCVIFTDNGCQQVVVSNPVKMVIYPKPNVILPNTFTPNGDNINDVWDIKYLDLYHYSTVKIYNRYGALLFQSKGYPQPWDGKYKGVIVPSGTYYYVIDLGIHTPLLSGPVTVIR